MNSIISRGIEFTGLLLICDEFGFNASREGCVL